MFDRQSLHIALLLWGCIFSLIAALCMFMSRNFEHTKRRWMLAMQLSCAALMLNDALAWGFRGIPGTAASAAVHISNYLVFTLSDVLLLLFHGYVCCYLFEGRTGARPRVRIHLGYGIAVLGIVLVAVSQFTGLYYTIDAANLYHRSARYALSVCLPICGMLVDLTLLIQYRANISRLIFVSMLSYIALPLLGAVGLLFYYGISLTNLAICVSMILMFVVAMIEQNRHLAQKEQEAADLRISLMLSQIAPHFIYNTLTTIQGLCTIDPPAAKETVGEFAGYLRGNLDSLSEKNPIPFARELEHVRCYLVIEQKRFGERVDVIYDIHETDFYIPALTLQPLVENAVKHGLCKKEEGGTVQITTNKKFGKGVEVIVRDDGVGFDPARIETSRSHVGLSNVRTRLERMCGGSLTVESIPGTGTTVTVFLPDREGVQSDEYFSGR